MTGKKEEELMKIAVGALITELARGLFGLIFGKKKTKDKYKDKYKGIV